METKRKTTKKKDGRGGIRPGAGRPKTKENPRVKMLTFRVPEATSRRIALLREATKDDEVPFLDMLDRWVEDYAKDYGID